MTRKRSLVRGFTLMEVMVAVGITALMGGLVAASFTSSFNAREVVQKEADRYRMIRTAFSRMSREIGAAYVSEAMARVAGRIGRSWGCPAVRTAVAHKLIDALKGGQMVFSYYPDKRWLASSQYLKCRNGQLAKAEANGAPRAGG